MNYFVVVRVGAYGHHEYHVLASTLLFLSQETAEKEAQKQLATYQHGTYEVYRLTDPVYTLTEQPTEAATSEA